MGIPHRLSCLQTLQIPQGIGWILHHNPWWDLISGADVRIPTSKYAFENYLIISDIRGSDILVSDSKYHI